MNWKIDTHLADHDAVKQGVTSQRVSRVILSDIFHMDPTEAEVTAALMSSTIHQAFPMPTRVSHCL